MRTRFVKLGAGKRREGATNQSTLIGGDPVAPGPDDVPFFQRVFEGHYPNLLEARESFGSAGVLVAAAHDSLGELEMVGVPCEPDQPNTAVVGRHGEADLYLERDPSLSLRHLLVFVYPRPEGERIRFRIVDLRTPLGFQDEHGRRLDSVTVDGPFFLRIGTYTVLLLPTVPEDEWPLDPHEAWQALPDRAYDEAHDAIEAAKPDEDGDRSALFTYVTTMRGPTRAAPETLVDGESPWGRLVLTTERGSDTLILGAAAARRGVLLGSYDRCDSDYLAALDDEYLSRVHLLVLASGGALYAVDTASTNGTTQEGRSVRCARLRAEDKLVLAGSVHLRWRSL